MSHVLSHLDSTNTGNTTEIRAINTKSNGDLEVVATKLLSPEGVKEVEQEERRDRLMTACRMSLREKTCKTCPYASSCPYKTR